MHLTPCNLIKTTIHTLSWCRAITDGNTGVPPHFSDSFTNKTIQLHHQLYMHDAEMFNGVTSRQHQWPTTYSPHLFELLLLASPDPHHSLVADISLTWHSFLSLSHFLLKPCCTPPTPLSSPSPGSLWICWPLGQNVPPRHTNKRPVPLLLGGLSSLVAPSWRVDVRDRKWKTDGNTQSPAKQLIFFFPWSIFFTLTQVVLTMSQRSFPGIICQFPSQQSHGFVSVAPQTFCSGSALAFLIDAIY